GLGEEIESELAGLIDQIGSVSGDRDQVGAVDTQVAHVQGAFRIVSCQDAVNAVHVIRMVRVRVLRVIRRYAQGIAGYLHATDSRIGQNAAAWRNDLHSVGKAVGNVDVVDAQPWNVDVLRTDGERTAPLPAGIITAAAINIASLGVGRATIEVRADWECAGDQDPATVGHVLEETIFDAVANASVDPTAIGKPGGLGGAM